MSIEILDSWKEFDTNFAIVKTSGGIFIISRGRSNYAVEGEIEHFLVQPCRISQKHIGVYWRVGENPTNVSKSSESFKADLSRIENLTGANPFELMELVKEKEED